MKKKLLVIALTIAMFLSSCSVKVCTYQHWNFGNNTPVYQCVTVFQRGPAQPIITVINPYRQMTRR